MENKTATQLLLETQQKEIETRVFKEKLLQLMKARLDKATRAFYLHNGQHGRIQGLNKQLSEERIELQEEMMKLRDIITSISKDKVLMTDMTMTFVIQDKGNIILHLVDTGILDFLKW